MPSELLSLIAAKEQKGEVHFLKRDDLEYTGYPGAEDPDAYGRVSTWLEVALSVPGISCPGSLVSVFGSRC